MPNVTEETALTGPDQTTRRPAFLCISGMVGSGKTTLARQLSGSHGWRYLPITVPGVAFLSDLFTDPSRWAFDAQASFLVHKATQLKESLLANTRIVLDRSLFEDVHVFASYFFEKGYFDERSASTYQTLAAHFLDELSPPDLIILCQSSLETLRRRIDQRGRDFQRNYPSDHLDSLWQKYEEWRLSFDDCALFYLDTEVNDVRRPETVRIIADEVNNLLTNSRHDAQLNLFKRSALQHHSNVNRVLVPINRIPVSARIFRQSESMTRTIDVEVTYPSCYLAAPFTSATALVSGESSTLPLSDAFARKRITPGAYRQLLTSIEKNMKKLGVSVVLPHRDISRWGDRNILPSRIAELCSIAVKRCDVFLGILGMSQGSHFEFGIAHGMGKPSIIIKPNDIEHSLIANGITESLDHVLVINVESLIDVPKAIESREVAHFLQRYIPIAQPEA